MEKQQGFWKQVLQGGGAFSPLVPSYEKANRYTKEAIVLFILYGYFSLPIIFGTTPLSFVSILGLLIPFLSSTYCLFLMKTIQNRSKKQVQLGWIIAYLMSLLALYFSLYYLNQIILLLGKLLLTIVWFDLGNFFRKSNN